MIHVCLTFPVMKIAFLCGSLEPGRDGVGDYTRRLAAELLKQGSSTIVVALNDTYVAQKITGEQELENCQVSVMRIPAAWSEKQRFSAAKCWIENFNPDWISLQFVPYAFHAGGVPLAFAFHLKQLVGWRRLHIMFHEIWIGADSIWALKEKLIAFLQKRIIAQLLSLVEHPVVHTHLPFYLYALKEVGCEAHRLALFSNIPATAFQLAMPGKPVVTIGLFSQISNANTVIDFIKSLAEDVAHSGRNLRIILIGGSEDRVKEFILRLRFFEVNIITTGFVDAHQVSEALSQCDLGLTPVPRHGLGKSGSVAAFIAHGVPVAAPVVHAGHDAQEIGFFSAALQATVVLNPLSDEIQRAQVSISAAREEIQVAAVARKFLQDIQP